MTKYVLNRLLLLVPVMMGVSFLVFALAKVTPGDPAAMMLGVYATPERIAETREHLGLNDPLMVQYGRFVWNALHGDLGTSFRGQTPVAREILSRFPSTLELTAAGMLLAILIGVPAGIIAATTKRRFVAGSTMVTALIGLSIPNFWLAIILIIVFGIKLGWLPVTGGDGLESLILPAFCLSLSPAAMLARLTRSSVLEVFAADYVRTARGKGLGERIVILRHVLRNALIPVITVIGLLFASMLGGTVFIESVFARPGLGRFAVSAIMARDYPQVQGVVLFSASMYVLFNLVVDLLYGVIDPRIQYE